MRGKFWSDLVERSIWTFLQAFAATFISDEVLGSLTISIEDKLALALTAGGVAVAKCLLATQFPNKGTAATADIYTYKA